MTDPVFIHPLPDSCAVGQVFELSGAEARHTEVKRMRDGELLVVSDGVGRAVRGCWMGGRVEVREVLAVAHPRPRVSVVQAIPKSERAELAVDLMTQAGADRIIPWVASRSIAKWDGKEEKARLKWENAARSAAKQARRFLVPEVTEQLKRPSELGALISDANSTRVVVLHESATKPIAEVDFDVDEIVLVVGPEGGVSEEELSAFAEYGGQPIVLGPQVLRTASAAAVALGAIGVLTPRWGKATIG